MATLTIRNLDATVEARLRMRAAERGHSIEAEARQGRQLALQTSATAGRPFLWRKRSDAWSRILQRTRRSLFRRMCFNALISNIDGPHATTP